MDKSVYSTEKISTGLAVSLETDQSSTRQFTILIRYLGAFDSLQEIAVFPIVPLLNRFAVGTASKEEILRLGIYARGFIHRPDTADGVRAGSTGRRPDCCMLSNV